MTTTLSVVPAGTAVWPNTGPGAPLSSLWMTTQPSTAAVTLSTVTIEPSDSWSLTSTESLMSPISTVSVSVISAVSVIASPAATSAPSAVVSPSAATIAANRSATGVPAASVRPAKRSTWPEPAAPTPLVVTRASPSALKAIDVGKERPEATTSDASPSLMRSSAPLSGTKPASLAMANCTAYNSPSGPLRRSVNMVRPLAKSATVPSSATVTTLALPGRKGAPERKPT